MAGIGGTQPRNPMAGTAAAIYTPGMNAHFQTGVNGDDGAWEDYQREAGSYQPGTIESVSDKITQGSDNE